MDLLSTEILFMIFKHLTPKEGYALGRVCHRYHSIYVEEFVKLKPKEYIFYYAPNHRNVELYEFLEIRYTQKKIKVIFDKRYSTCDKCVLLKNERCKDEENHKCEYSFLKFDREGRLSCVNPRTRRGRVFAIEKMRVVDLFKSVCQKCVNLKLCKSCSVIDGNCGIARCARSILPMNFNLWSFKGANYTHYHDLCEECFDGISKNIMVNLFVNNVFPE
jgi:hypothetical protein